MDRVLSLPALNEAVRVAERAAVEARPGAHALEGASGPSQSMHRPVVGTERSASGAVGIRARFRRRASEPSVAELMRGGRAVTAFRVGRNSPIHLPVIQLLPVHVGVGPDGTSLHGTIAPEG